MIPFGFRLGLGWREVSPFWGCSDEDCDKTARYKTDSAAARALKLTTACACHAVPIGALVPTMPLVVKTTETANATLALVAMVVRFAGDDDEWARTRDMRVEMAIAARRENDTLHEQLRVANERARLAEARWEASEKRATVRD